MKTTKKRKKIKDFFEHKKSVSESISVSPSVSVHFSDIQKETTQHSEMMPYDEIEISIEKMLDELSQNE